MCSLCGVLGGRGHWADSSANPGVFSQREHPATLRGERLERVRIINRILRHYALSVDEWEGTSYILRTRTGRSELVEDLPQLWAVAETLLKRGLDPLDPALLATLGQGE